MATGGGRISPPGRWGGSRPPTVAGSIFFFSFVHRKSRRRWAANGGVWRHPSPEVGSGLFIWWLDLLIGCFDFIFSLCNFLKWVRCQLSCKNYLHIFMYEFLLRLHFFKLLI
jgi:hypothetical protein